MEKAEKTEVLCCESVELEYLDFEQCQHVDEKVPNLYLMLSGYR